MKNLFKPRVKLTTLEQNKFNGKSAERYFAANLTISLDARVFWATRTEDDSKVDLVTVISHPWVNNHVDVLFTQIKSGPSFVEPIKGSDEIRFLVKKEKFKHLLNRNHNTLICWSNVEFDEPFWFIIKANAKYCRVNYREIHKLTPLSRFDIIRVLTSFNNTNGGKGLTFKIKEETFLDKRKNAKALYKNLMSAKVENPLFGAIEFSRLGWRHITRTKRLNKYKVNSFDLLSVINKILVRTPSKHVCYSEQYEEVEENRYRVCEYILTYNDLQGIKEDSGAIKPVNVYIKLLEFSSYMIDWRAAPNFSSIVNRRVVFKSIYYKEKK